MTMPVSLSVWLRVGQRTSLSSLTVSRKYEAMFIYKNRVLRLVSRIIQLPLNLVQAGVDLVQLIGSRFDGQAEEEIEDGNDADKSEEDAQHEDGQGRFGQLGQVGDDGFEAGSLRKSDSQILEHSL